MAVRGKFRPMIKSLSLVCALSFALGLVQLTAEEAAAEKQAEAGPGEKQADPKDTKPGETKEVAVMKTSEGEMVFEFWTDVAPKTVENFKKLAKENFYNGTAFHRIMATFMVQGGDPNTKDPSKEDFYGGGGPGYTIKAEFNKKPHERGVLSMARSNDPDSAGSQFFICTVPADNPGMQYLNGKYTGFGKLIKGDETLEKIAKTPVGPNRSGELSKPLKRVVIESVKIVPADSTK